MCRDGVGDEWRLGSWNETASKHSAVPRDKGESAREREGEGARGSAREEGLDGAERADGVDGEDGEDVDSDVVVAPTARAARGLSGRERLVMWTEWRMWAEWRMWTEMWTERRTWM